MLTEKRTTRLTPTDLLERIARGESRTDLKRVRAKSEQELKRDIAEDEASEVQPGDWVRAAEAITPAASKQAVSMRLDRDVLDWFKAEGPGYQTRIKAVLRDFVML